VQPHLQAIFGDVPVIGGWFAGPPIGVGILTAGIVLSLMVIPFVASVMRDVFETVPPQLKESAYGVGCTTWEVVTGVVLPYTRVGVIGGIMLGLGRALGETMAVTFVIGNANRIVGSLFAPGTSIASTLANEFGEADPGLHIAALFALGLVLFVITFIVLAISRWLIRRGVARQGK
jgi:phosphate transport system permease protein